MFCTLPKRRTEMTKAEQVLALIETHAFEKWYEEDFLPYIEDSKHSKTKPELLEFLERKLSQIAKEWG